MPTAIPCEGSLVIAGRCSESPFAPIFTQVLTAVKDAGLEGSCMVPPQRCSNCTEPPEVNASIPSSNQTDCPESLTHSKLLCNRHMNTSNVMQAFKHLNRAPHKDNASKELVYK